MGIEKKPFVRYKTDEEKEKEKREVITIGLNPTERQWLNENKLIINQLKDGTALKQLAYIGSIVLQDNSTKAIIEALFINKRRNKRIGVIDFD